jgi:uncharacterized protein
MNTKIKLLFTGLLILTTLAACAPGPLGGIIVTKPMPDTSAVQNPQAAPTTIPPQPAGTSTQPRTISVSGIGKVYIVPDIAYINIGVNTRSAQVAEALSANNTQSIAVQKALETAGVDPKDIQTTSFNVYPQPQYDNNGKITTTEYVVDNTVSVTVRNLDKLSSLLDTVIRSGANSINSIQFDVQDKAKAFADARQLAVNDAHNQAGELAAASGVQLGQVDTITVVEINNPVPLNYAANGLGGGSPAAAPNVPVSAGQLMVTVTLNVTYDIK